jgi:hypothetical protein
MYRRMRGGRWWLKHIHIVVATYGSKGRGSITCHISYLAIATPKFFCLTLLSLFPSHVHNPLQIFPSTSLRYALGSSHKPLRSQHTCNTDLCAFHTSHVTHTYRFLVFRVVQNPVDEWMLAATKFDLIAEIFLDEQTNIRIF